MMTEKYFRGPYYTIIENLWEHINLRNTKFPIQEENYIFDIPLFNKEVIREALNNAIAHRNYRVQSEIVIKQFPSELYIISPGGFPLGVTKDNLLTINSTPRNRLYADVLAKTGAGERSGQGIDKIYYQCLTESKPTPDYSKSDDFQVELRLSGVVQDTAFALFIKKIQERLKEKEKEEQLSVTEVLALNNIRLGCKKQDISKDILKKLVENNIIEIIGNTRAQRVRLSKEYYSLTNKEALYSKETPLNLTEAALLVTNHLKKFKTAKMGSFVDIFDKHNYSREQVKNLIYLLLKQNYLASHGEGPSRKYSLNKKSRLNNEELLEKIIKQVLKN